jgi:hypothetical protein
MKPSISLSLKDDKNMDMDKNIAMMIVGRIDNNWKSSFANTKKYLLNNYKNIYVFASTYKLENEESDLDEFRKAYNVLDINIETYSAGAGADTGSDSFWTKSTNKYYTYRCMSMLFHTYKAFELVEKYQKNNGINFDIVLKWRSDLNPLSPFIFDNIKDDIVYHQYPTTPNVYRKNWFPDQHNYGTFKTMKIYCNIFNNVIDYFNKYNIVLDVIEILIYEHMKINDIIWSFSENTWTYTLMRNPDNTSSHYKNFINILVDNEIKGETLLDVGCGQSSELFKFYSENFNYIICCDKNELIIEINSYINKKINFICCDATEEMFPEKFGVIFDVIVFKDVIIFNDVSVFNDVIIFNDVSVFKYIEKLCKFCKTLVLSIEINEELTKESIERNIGSIMLNIMLEWKEIKPVEDMFNKNTLIYIFRKT